MPRDGHTEQPDAHGEYRRLLAAGVNEISATELVQEMTARARAERDRALGKGRDGRRTLRTKTCGCGMTVQASNLARHRRTHENRAA